MKTFEQEKQEMLSQAEKFRDAAFPVTLELQYASNPNLSYRATSKGLSKRELFAAMAMQGELAAQNETVGMVTNKDAFARSCVAFADALLKHLEPKETNND